jgi:hypothetical protein
MPPICADCKAPIDSCVNGRMDGNRYITLCDQCNMKRSEKP